MTENAPLAARHLAAAAAGPQHLLGEFPTYAAAEAVVDKLSDRGFPVQNVRIVGNGVRSVEYVTGRMTTGKAASAGAVSGAWFGLMIGLLLGMVNGGSGYLVRLFSAMLIGVVWGAAFGASAHRATRGRRDFSSRKTFEADSYSVFVDAAHADEAIRAAGLF
ncbi:MAG: hypothetical protein QOF57_536 [Frankiaceae bacterium]|jgi:hypothetical protein|nr:hypothetical protein [Frankiaceae bacterium]